VYRDTGTPTGGVVVSNEIIGQPWTQNGGQPIKPSVTCAKAIRAELRSVMKTTSRAFNGGDNDRSPTHLSLNKEAPIPRPVADTSAGRIVAISEVGGLHHRYERRAA